MPRSVALQREGQCVLCVSGGRNAWVWDPSAIRRRASVGTPPGFRGAAPAQPEWCGGSVLSSSPPLLHPALRAAPILAQPPAALARPSAHPQACVHTCAPMPWIQAAFLFMFVLFFWWGPDFSEDGGAPEKPPDLRSRLCLRSRHSATSREVASALRSPAAFCEGLLLLLLLILLLSLPLLLLL
ncbi:unnamed protein product, partial [Prorocentrum cordatum]